MALIVHTRKKSFKLWREIMRDSLGTDRQTSHNLWSCLGLKRGHDSIPKNNVSIYDKKRDYLDLCFLFVYLSKADIPQA